MEDLISVQELSIGFNIRDLVLPAVDRISFSVRQGETLGIVGESGSGKSLSARAILGLLPSAGRIDDGRIIYRPEDGDEIDIVGLPKNGSAIRKLRGAEIAMIFQEPMASLSPVHTIGDQVVTALRHHTDLDKRAALSYAIDLLDQVGIASPSLIAGQYAHQLSGGMRQRAMIAISLSCSPRLLICDEPTTALDATTEAQVVDLLMKLQEERNMGMIFISHNIGLVREVADRAMVMYLGQSIESGSTEQVFNQPAHPYTRALMNALPAFSEAGSELVSLKGTVPDLTARPSGCAFHTRCPEYAGLRCQDEAPDIHAAANSHLVRCHLHA